MYYLFSNLQIFTTTFTFFPISPFAECGVPQGVIEFKKGVG